MNILTAVGLSKSFSEELLFADVNISLLDQQKTAIIAENGRGKSTILKIIAGKEFADSGNVSMRNSVKLGYLEQDPIFPSTSRIIDTIFDGHSEQSACIKDYELELSLGEEADTDKLQLLSARMEFLNAWDYESKITEILGKLGIHDLTAGVSTLSGGQLKRLALARLLIEEPDLLLLDEPTNQLDLEMIEWLESHLIKINKTLLMVTHDRYFLDNVCDSIIEIDNGRSHYYKGGYAYFLEQKANREHVEGQRVDKAKQLMKNELEWMRRQPKARTTKQKARVDSFYDTQDIAKSGKRDHEMKFGMNMTRLGSKILELEYICKSYGDKVLLENFSHIFKKGEKIGILGKNGSGKSTFLKMITGEVKPDRGKIRAGSTVVFGYYKQEGIKLPEDKRVIDVMRDIAEEVEMQDQKSVNIIAFLNYFKFTGPKQQTFVSRLSGGERRRLYLLTLLIRQPNFLILDEPTNDLDIGTLNLLEEFLASYEGCMLLVTHDRYFMDRLVDHVFVFSGNGVIRDIHGNYTDYRSMLIEESRKPQEKVSSTKKTSRSERPKTKLSFNEEREIKDLEKEIADLEAQKKELEHLLSSPEGIDDEIEEISKKFAATEAKLEQKTNRWIEISSSLE